jgi:hypothetical protein
MKPYLVTTESFPFKRLVIFAKDALDAFRRVQQGQVDRNPWTGKQEDQQEGETAHSAWPIGTRASVIDIPRN